MNSSVASFERSWCHNDFLIWAIPLVVCPNPLLGPGQCGPVLVCPLVLVSILRSPIGGPTMLGTVLEPSLLELPVHLLYSVF